VDASDELLLQRHYAEKQEWTQTQTASFNLNCEYKTACTKGRLDADPTCLGNRVLFIWPGRRIRDFI